MKVLIPTLGTRGDIQPYLALAVGLQHAGHQVTLAAPGSFKSWIETYGVAVHPVKFNPQEVAESITHSKNAFRAIQAMREVVQKGAVEAAKDIWRAAQDCDFLLQTGTGGSALEISAKRGIPVAFAQLMPTEPTRAFPSFIMPYRKSLGSVYNRLTHTLTQKMLWNMMGASAINSLRAYAGLPAWRSLDEMQDYSRKLGAPALYAFSPSLLPRPTDWPDGHHITGYWFLDPPTGWQPPAALLRFLENGPPPVYIGFGSTSARNPEQQKNLALRALAISGQRGIISTGWGAMSRTTAPENVFVVENVPHAWLFSHVAAVVHHGGAGTTAAGLRAGVPGIVSAFGGDQIAWADLVVKAGAGPRVPSMKNLSAEKLAQAIHTALNTPAMRTQAAALGEMIRLEDGVACAVEIIERHAHCTFKASSTSAEL